MESHMNAFSSSTSWNRQCSQMRFHLSPRLGVGVEVGVWVGLLPDMSHRLAGCLLIMGHGLQKSEKQVTPSGKGFQRDGYFGRRTPERGEQE